VGAGGSQEAAYELKTGVPTGTYHLVLDGIVIESVDVEFDLLWRRDGADTTLAMLQRHFDPTPGSAFDAQAVTADVSAPAIEFQPGDQLVLRYTGTTSADAEAYIPNGDGVKKGGRDPNITLPQ
jgi:hypothetical protein